MPLRSVLVAKAWRQYKTTVLVDVFLRSLSLTRMQQNNEHKHYLRKAAAAVEEFVQKHVQGIRRALLHPGSIVVPLLGDPTHNRLHRPSHPQI